MNGDTATTTRVSVSDGASAVNTITIPILKNARRVFLRSCGMGDCLQSHRRNPHYIAGKRFERTAAIFCAMRRRTFSFGLVPSKSSSELVEHLSILAKTSPLDAILGPTSRQP